MERAEKTVYAFYVTAALALAALVGMKKFPKAATPLAVARFSRLLRPSAWVAGLAKPADSFGILNFVKARRQTRLNQITSTNAPNHELI